MGQGSAGRLLAVAAALIALALVPSSASAPGGADGDPLGLALAHLAKHAPELGVTSADVADVFVTSSYRSDHNGVVHVNLGQRYRGLEVFGGHVTVNVAADGRVLLAAGSLVPGLRAAATAEAKLEATDAVEKAASALELGEPVGLEVLEEAGGPARETLLSDGGISEEPIPARLGWQPGEGGLRLAWQLVIDDSSDVHLWRAVVDAETGTLLDADDWTSHDTVADLAGLARSTSSASATLTGGSPTPVVDGSSYRVFDFPKESPNDGDRGLVTNPADALASPFGWHDTNGASGPEFTTTRGNNVHAYLDQDANNAPDFGLDTDGGAGLTFDFPADLREHAQNYRNAVDTNLFYANNVFHDVVYGRGFDEAAGNFQANNYLRGGTQGDYVRAEAADGGGTNNANFSTPVETATTGGTPRMQMFLWPGNQFGAQNQVVADGVGSYDASWARFSPAPTVAGTAGRLVDAGNGCTAADYAGAPAGDWIAIVTGSNVGCQNVDKARQAGAAGAKALIVALNAGGAAPILTGSLTTAPPTIPVASITQADGNAIRAAIAAGPTTGTVRKHPDHPGIRDGDFENGIIIHEYTHGVSLRLTGGPAVNCLTGDEQGGEGWSDWYALAVLLDPSLDDPEGRRGMGPYALFQDSREGAGIRPAPYSRNMAIQPFTYDSIKSGGWLEGASLAVPHGVGHGWAAVLWDLTWELVDKHGFNPDLYDAWSSGGNNRALQYVTDGLKLQGCGPGFLAARDGIIAATEALGGEDTCTAWAAFARRGLGFSAVQGGTGRNDNDEAFDTHPDCLEGFSGGIEPGPALNVKKAGAALPLTFTTGGGGGLDILAENNPYSRLVDCNTLRTVDPLSQFVTPRPIPVPTETSGNSRLSYDSASGWYTYPWKSLGEWAGTCRELVLTRKDGVQHRAFFHFAARPSFTVSGRVRDVSGELVPGATVRLDGDGDPLVATTDDAGFYSFDLVPKGTYAATASAGGCNDPRTIEVEVASTTRLDFSLPEKRDAFGYTCRVVDAPFDEAGNVVPLTGDDVARTIDLPFTFRFYGFPYTRAHVCSNGFVELLGPAATTCPFSNAALPAAARPNGVVYPFWDDLVVDASASIRTEAKGTAPDRRFVIEFENVHFFNDTTRRVDFNVVLHENGDVVTQYKDIADDGRERGNSATIGIENHAGTVALQYSQNEAVLGVEPAVTSIRFRPPPPAPAFTVSGHVRDTEGNPVADASVAIAGTPIAPATTDATGFYAFELVPAGTYDVTAARACKEPQTRVLELSGPTTLDFTLGAVTDAFGYTCRLEEAPFEEASTVVPITGDDAAGTVTLPFPFTHYGAAYTQAYVCTNGFVEFVGPPTTACPFTNVALPATARPNGAVYGFWDDLVVDSSASIRTETKGLAPERRFVIEFRNVRFIADLTRRLDFNVVLHENGDVVTQYRNIGEDLRERGDSATIGIENGAGTVALLASFNTAFLGVEPAVTSIRYRPPG